MLLVINNEDGGLHGPREVSLNRPISQRFNLDAPLLAGRLGFFSFGLRAFVSLAAMKILLRLIVLLLVLAVCLWFYARSLPAHTTHTRSITLKQSPETVFALLADLQNMPKWNSNMEKIEMLPPIDGKEATRQTFKGNMKMTIITSESTPPTHLVRTMVDDGGPFSGSWTYAISPTANGGTVALTEQSNVPNPFFRLMMRLFGPTKYLDEHLQDIAKNFGETATAR